MTDKLKPCPFCGGQAVQLFSVNAETYVYGCYKSGCMGNAQNSLCHFKTDKEAIKAWNTRKPMDRIVEQLNKELRYDSGYPTCSMEDWAHECSMNEARKKAIDIVKGVQNECKDKSE